MFVLCNKHHQYLHGALNNEVHHAPYGHAAMGMCAVSRYTPPRTDEMLGT